MRADGTVFPVEVIVVPAYDEGPVIEQTLGRANTITHRIRTEIGWTAID